MLTETTVPDASTMKYMTGLCSNISFHCASLLRSASIARASALLRLCRTVSICLWVVPTRRIMINEATSEATSSANATKKAGAVGTGAKTSQMHAVAANAIAMPPSSHCSAERDKLVVG
ncbi:hypothetical protein [Bradyrhizobium sp. CB3481]|uniref:hypothetical protein n=1 Tax=Bradyrhizobium sp. CB3481 TaxID=3039158 RepID=UPI0024B10D65|nr:hypothetical protein [Bradyrhizobium sp. CB3481]WFU20791.1 hypothetical protein QA643_38295 [Bradyrhizobium sp. CB3481]